MSTMTSTTTSTDPTSGRHPLNIGHLVMGLALLGIVGIWALVESDTVTGDDIRWLLPVPWVLAGVVGLTASAVTGTRRYAVRQAGWAGEQPAEPVTESASAPHDQPGDQPHDQPDDQPHDQSHEASQEER